MRDLIKICGLSTPETLETALHAGANLVGFVRFEKSPRHVSLELGADLSRQAKDRATRVVLVVNPTDKDLREAAEALSPDMLQLHGTETPERILEISERYRLPIIKAIGIGSIDDLALVDRYRPVADRLLLDAKPPPGAALPGGNGLPFDWTLIRKIGSDPSVMLSGGLNPENVAQAIVETGVHAIDVSSGVECAPGVKDSGKIEAFIQAARNAWKN